MKKILIVVIVLCAVAGVGFAGYKIYTDKVNISSEQENKDEGIYSPITEEEIKNASVEATSSDALLSDEGRATFSELYTRYGKELESKIQVTDAEIDSYMADGEVQYPAIKVTAEKDGVQNVYYMDDKEGLGEDAKAGDETPLGKIVEIGELQDSDKREVVKAIIHNSKVSNVLVRRIEKSETK